MSVEVTRDKSYEEYTGGVSGVPMMLEVPTKGGKVVAALRASDMSLSIQHLDGVAPFVTMSLITLYDHGVFLALSPADLRSIGAALIGAADTLDGGAGKQ